MYCGIGEPTTKWGVFLMLRKLWEAVSRLFLCLFNPDREIKAKLEELGKADLDWRVIQAGDENDPASVREIAVVVEATPVRVTYQKPLTDEQCSELNTRLSIPTGLDPDIPHAPTPHISNRHIEVFVGHERVASGDAPWLYGFWLQCDSRAQANARRAARAASAEA